MALKTVPFNVAFTFSRPDPADYEDVNGDTQTAGTDVPRFNYSEGVGEGLMLDASLSETAAINDIPNFNSSSGTWVIKADLDKSKPIPGSGFGEFMEGSGTLVFVYSNGVGKCWADGEVLFTVDPFSAAEPGFLSNGGLAKVQDLTYYPYAWTDEGAAAKSSGAFSTYFSPDLLFADGTDGFWGDSTDGSTLFQESAGTTPAGPGDPCGLRIDKSGNGNDQTQATTAAKPTVQTVGGVQALVLDDTDDSMLIDVPAGGWSGTFVQGTALGVIVGEIDVTAGPYQIPTDPNYAGPGSDIHTVIVNRSMVSREVDGLVEWVGQRCPARGFSGVTVMRDWFRSRTDLVALDASRWDTSSVTSFNTFAANCPSLSVLDVSNWDTSSVNSFRAFVTNCTNLAVLDVSNWDTAGVNDFISFAQGCTNLAVLDVSNWDTAGVNDFISFAQGCTNLAVLDVSNWDTAGVNSFRAFVQSCSGLTALDVSNWDTAGVNDFDLFAANCPSLSVLDVFGGTGSPFSDSPCTKYANAFTNTNLNQQSYTDLVTAIEAAGTSSGVLDITGGASTTTGAAQTAVDALRGRGWTVTTPDGY
jgi:surface protein